MKEMGSGMGTESRLDRSKGESRQDNIHLEPGNSHISNNEGEIGCYDVLVVKLQKRFIVLHPFLV